MFFYLKKRISSRKSSHLLLYSADFLRISDLQFNLYLAIRSLVLVISHSCCIEHTHRCLYSCASIIFVTVVDNFFDSTLNDCFCTLITWEKRHIELCSFQTSSTEIQNRIQFTVYCIDIFCLVSNGSSPSLAHGNSSSEQPIGSPL